PRVQPVRRRPARLPRPQAGGAMTRTDATTSTASTSTGTTSTVLTVDGLDVRAGSTPLLRDVTFTIQRGERVGLIGESGSGKSLTALSVMGLLAEGLQADGEIRLAGQDGNLLAASERTLSRVRGNTMAMIFQEPMTALNPT